MSGPSHLGMYPSNILARRYICLWLWAYIYLLNPSLVFHSMFPQGKRYTRSPMKCLQLHYICQWNSWYSCLLQKYTAHCYLYHTCPRSMACMRFDPLGLDKILACIRHRTNSCPQDCNVPFRRECSAANPMLFLIFLRGRTAHKRSLRRCSQTFQLRNSDIVTQVFRLSAMQQQQDRSNLIQSFGIRSYQLGSPSTLILLMILPNCPCCLETDHSATKWSHLPQILSH